MPKATNSSALEANPEPLPEEMHISSQDEQSSSEQEPDTEITFHHSRQPQPVPGMLCHTMRVPRWTGQLTRACTRDSQSGDSSVRNILECKPATLPERQQCKKVIAWSGHSGMEQYVSWGLSTDQLMLDTIWGRFEEFCKPQSNEGHARFDLLTSFRQGSRSVDEWYNAVQAQVNLAKYPPETAKILTGTSFGCS